MNCNKEYIDKIKKSAFGIYDCIDTDSELWIPAKNLEEILNNGLKGISVEGYPNRTRSKIIKEKICEVLGYPIPRIFKKTQPRFIGQSFDSYIQKSNNLQIWNESISPERRYVIIKVSEDSIITRVKVIKGNELAKLNTTGTLTQKYQAKLKIEHSAPTKLITPKDTENITRLVNENAPKIFTVSPVLPPSTNNFLSISEIFCRLSGLINETIPNPGQDQERNRGAELHKLVCKKLGYQEYQDKGSFPDIPNQLLEVKLQTAATIDLGLVTPDSQNPIKTLRVDQTQILNCDIRYAIFYGTIQNNDIVLKNFYLTTGKAFFQDFQRFEGNVTNTKIQIPLPKDFFN